MSSKQEKEAPPAPAREPGNPPPEESAPQPAGDGHWGQPGSAGPATPSKDSDQ